MSRKQGPAVVVAGVEFGWGSAGKLDAIIEELRRMGDIRVVVLGTRLGRPVLGAVSVEAWYEEWPSGDGELHQLLRTHGVAAGLVILDPKAAERLESASVPTVYVDSIPYLWTPADYLPTDVTVYCAQEVGQLPAPAKQALLRVSNLTWIEAVISRHHIQRRSSKGLAVLNLGGLHSPTHATGNPDYLALVLPAALRALQDAGVDRIEVCGNLRDSDLRHSAGVTLPITTAPRSHREFMDLLAAADVLVTSPGLTTLLEAGALGVPTVCLPPQNLSQIFNGDRFARSLGEECRIRWPVDVLDLEALDRARLDGEEAGLAFIAAALHGHEPEAFEPWLQRAVSKALTSAEDPRDWHALTNAVGAGGARHVASMLRELAFERYGTRDAGAAIPAF